MARRPSREGSWRLGGGIGDTHNREDEGARAYWELAAWFLLCSVSALMSLPVEGRARARTEGEDGGRQRVLLTEPCAKLSIGPLRGAGDGGREPAR